MAISPLPNTLKSLTFDGKTSSSFGVAILGEGVFNAPQRAVEMINIPGRNGAFALDQGRFENITVTYPANLIAESTEDFAEGIAAFRNFLCSRKGYVRLSDDYNPDEYRLAVYKSGLEVDESVLRAGEFKLSFDCKPQRFLVSGETEQTSSDWSDVETETGSIVTIEADDTTGIKDVTADIEPIQSGSGDPSPSNIRPISGHTDVVVVRTGENLVSEDAILEGYQYNSSGVLEVNSSRLSIDRIKCVGNRYVSISWKSTTATSRAIRCVWDKNGNLLVRGIPTETSLGNNRYGYVQDLNSYPTAEYIGFTLYCTDSADANTVTSEYMVSAPSTSTTVSDFKPYGDTYTTALGTTVYGGTLDVTTGVLTVTHGYIDMGDCSWSRLSAGGDKYVFYTTTISKALNYNFITSAYRNAETTRGSLNDGECGVTNTSDYTFCVRDDRYSAANAYKTAVSGYQLCYELATPTTVQLTAQQIDLLLGQNNVWASSGDVTVEYGEPPFTNPTLFASNPLIKVTGIGTLTVGDTSIVITGTASQVVYIDCESKEIYKINGGVITPAGSLVSFSTPDFPQLKPGINKVVKGTGITDVEITPRWWRI